MTNSSTSAQTRQSPGRNDLTEWNRLLEKRSILAGKIEAAMEGLKEAECAAFETRARLKAFEAPDCLNVDVVVRVYVDDGVSPPIDRESVQETQLRSTSMIAVYAAKDAQLQGRLQEALEGWERDRASLEAAAEAARRKEVTANRRLARVMDADDQILLQLLETPAPSLVELRWKVDELRKEECSSETEGEGWRCVSRDFAAFAGRIDASLGVAA